MGDLTRMALTLEITLQVGPVSQTFPGRKVLPLEKGELEGDQQLGKLHSAKETLLTPPQPSPCRGGSIFVARLAPQ